MEDIGLPSEKVRMAEYIFGWIFATLMEAVHVELADEGVDVSVSEVAREDLVLELVDLSDGEFTAVGQPVDDGLVLFVLEDLEALLDEVGDGVVGGLY